MSATYELWLTDDHGKRILLLKDAAYFSYSRVVNGFGTLQFGYPYRLFKEVVYPVFSPDCRVEVWRSPAFGYPMQLEGVFLLRMVKIYTREEDNMDMIEFFARSPLDLLARRWVIQAAGTTYAAKTDEIDDMMKAIVREQMLSGWAVDKDGALSTTRAYPATEFTVQGDLALGPSVSRRFADRNVLDILKELKDTSFQLHEDDPANRKIYFDVVPIGLKGLSITIPGTSGDAVILDEIYVDFVAYEMLGEMAINELLPGIPARTVTSLDEKLGFQFQTFADLRGQDRTDMGGVLFSVANGNLKGPSYSKSHMEEKNSIIVKGSGRGESRSTIVVDDATRVDASRWNRCEDIFEANYEVDDTELQDVGAAQLKVNQPVEELLAVFLSVPGSEDVPRCLYRIDWDLGDLVRAWYAEQLFTCEVVVVYVAVDENGVETISGRNTVEGAV